MTLTSAAPGGGFQVSLSSNNANLSVPANVTVASGQTTATFTATASTVNTDQNGVVITASAASVTATTTLNLVAPPQLQSLSCSPSTLASNATSTCTAVLNKAVTSSTGVSLSSNNVLLTVPGSVTFTTGQTSRTFSANSGVVAQNQTATVTASLNSVNQQFTLNLTAPAQLSGVSCSPTSFNAAGTSACTVSLAAPAPAGTSATVSSNNAKVTVPGSVAVSTGQSSATFTATIGAPSSNQTATVTVTLNGVSRTASVSLVVPSLVSVACNPSTLGSNQSSSCTVTLSGNAGVSTVVGLASNKAALQVPASVTVAPGSSTATFSATTLTVSSNDVAVMTATLSGVNQTANINLTVSSQLGGVACVPNSLASNGVAACTVGLTQPAVNATVVTLSSNLNTLTVPPTATIAAGQTNASFNATAGTITTGSVATISATLSGQTVTTQVALNAPVQLSSVNCSPASFSAAGTSTCTVSLTGPASAATNTTISSDNAKVAVPGFVAVSTGQSSATFTATIAAPSSNQTATVTASLNGIVRTAAISLVVPSLSTLVCSPSTLGSNQSTTCTVFLDGNAAIPTIIGLASTKTALQVPASVTVQTGSSTAIFSAVTANLSSSDQATVTATLNGQSRQRILVWPLLSRSSALTCAPTSLTSNGSTVCTVLLTQPATNGVLLAVSSSFSSLIAPSAVTIDLVRTSASFSATAGTITTAAVANISVTLAGKRSLLRKSSSAARFSCAQSVVRLRTFHPSAPPCVR